MSRNELEIHEKLRNRVIDTLRRKPEPPLRPSIKTERPSQIVEYRTDNPIIDCDQTIIVTRGASSQKDQNMNGLRMLDFELLELEKRDIAQREAKTLESYRDLEERMLKFERECESRFRSELESQLRRLRTVELNSIRLQEQDRARADNERYRASLDNMHSDRLERLHQIELSSMGKIRAREQALESKVAEARRDAEAKLASLHAREEEIHRAQEANERERRTLKLALEDREDLLNQREQELQRQLEEERNRCERSINNSRREAHDELKTDFAKLYNEQAQLLKDRARLEGERENLERRASEGKQLESEVKVLRESERQSRIRLADAAQTLSETREQLRAVNDSVNRLQLDNTRVSALLSAEEKRSRTLEELLEHAKSTANGFVNHESMQSQARLHSGWSSRISQLEDELLDMKKRMVDDSAEMKRMEVELQQLRTEKSALELILKRHQHSDDSRNNGDHAAVRTEVELQMAQIRLKQLETEASRHSAALEIQTKRAIDAETALESLRSIYKAEIQALKTQCSDLERQVSVLQLLNSVPVNVGEELVFAKDVLSTNNPIPTKFGTGYNAAGVVGPSSSLIMPPLRTLSDGQELDERMELFFRKMENTPAASGSSGYSYSDDDEREIGYFNRPKHRMSYHGHSVKTFKELHVLNSNNDRRMTTNIVLDNAEDLEDDPTYVLQSATQAGNKKSMLSYNLSNRPPLQTSRNTWQQEEPNQILISGGTNNVNNLDNINPSNSNTNMNINNPHINLDQFKGAQLPTSINIPSNALIAASSTFTSNNDNMNNSMLEAQPNDIQQFSSQQLQQPNTPGQRRVSLMTSPIQQSARPSFLPFSGVTANPFREQQRSDDLSGPSTRVDPFTPSGLRRASVVMSPVSIPVGLSNLTSNINAANANLINTYNTAGSGGTQGGIPQTSFNHMPIQSNSSMLPHLITQHAANASISLLSTSNVFPPDNFAASQSPENTHLNNTLTTTNKNTSGNNINAERSDSPNPHQQPPSLSRGSSPVAAGSPFAVSPSVPFLVAKPSPPAPLVVFRPSTPTPTSSPDRVMTLHQKTSSTLQNINKQMSQPVDSVNNITALPARLSSPTFAATSPSSLTNQIVKEKEKFEIPIVLSPSHNSSSSFSSSVNQPITSPARRYLLNSSSSSSIQAPQFASKSKTTTGLKLNSEGAAVNDRRPLLLSPSSPQSSSPLPAKFSTNPKATQQVIPPSSSSSDTSHNGERKLPSSATSTSSVSHNYYKTFKSSNATGGLLGASPTSSSSPTMVDRTRKELDALKNALSNQNKPQYNNNLVLNAGGTGGARRLLLASSSSDGGFSAFESDSD